MNDDIESGTDETAIADGETVGAAAGANAAVEAELSRALEAILMAATEPVEPSVLAQLLEQPATLVNRMCQRLAASYEEDQRGFQLVRVAGGWRYQTHPDTVAYVERFVLDGQRARLSGAALETLAIIAYKQPISRAQIASIRGVDPDGVLRTLQSRGYVDQIARDPGPGQAVMWGTTVRFLEKLGLDSLADLPPLAGFVPGADVVEALEQGLRVTPIVEPATPAPPLSEGSASDGDTAQGT